uniref:Ovule protein n=1 Tax=Steinernema glaseri TaxID=37863 RepID=A0A1I7Z9R1_9BILA
MTLRMKRHSEHELEPRNYSSLATDKKKPLSSSKRAKSNDNVVCFQQYFNMYPLLSFASIHMRPTLRLFSFWCTFT